MDISKRCYRTIAPWHGPDSELRMSEFMMNKTCLALLSGDPIGKEKKRDDDGRILSNIGDMNADV